MGAPRLYFIMQSKEWPRGCHHATLETSAQKRKKVGMLDGEDLYTDEREDSKVSPDHAYDTLRYHVAEGGKFRPKRSRKELAGTFAGARALVAQQKMDARRGFGL